MRFENLNGTYLYKSLFPENIMSADAFKEILESLNNIIAVKYEEGKTRMTINCTSKISGIPIQMIIEVATGKIITAHPCLEEVYMKNLEYISINEFFNT